MAKVGMDQNKLPGTWGSIMKLFISDRPSSNQYHKWWPGQYQSKIQNIKWPDGIWELDTTKAYPAYLMQ